MPGPCGCPDLRSPRTVMNHMATTPAAPRQAATRSTPATAPPSGPPALTSTKTAPNTAPTSNPVIRCM
ncbi:hypothetical protein GCM10020001_040620 [Nonomuraea salmonea]